MMGYGGYGGGEGMMGSYYGGGGGLGSYYGGGMGPGMLGIGGSGTGGGKLYFFLVSTTICQQNDCGSDWRKLMHVGLCIEGSPVRSSH